MIAFPAFAAKAGKAIIADEMGLGKTIQAIGTAELLRKEGLIGSVPVSYTHLDVYKRQVLRF